MWIHVIYIYIYIYIYTSASVKSYQLVKVVSGGRAPGKSSSLASPQLLVIEQFHCFGAVRLEKVQFFIALIKKNIFDHSFKGANAGCCLPAACLLLACCLPAACLLLPCCLPATCCCLLLLTCCCSPAACLLLAAPCCCLLLFVAAYPNLFNLCPSKSSLCAMLRLFLTTSPSMDETGCAMVILLPWCDFPLPDVTSPYRRRAMGMMWLFPPDVT